MMESRLRLHGNLFQSAATTSRIKGLRIKKDFSQDTKTQ